MTRVTKTEIACLAAAAVFLAVALGVRLGSSDSGGQIWISAADRAAVASPATAADETISREDGVNIDINSADAETLTLLPGIGDVLAGRIVVYREENGAFKDISDIMYVDGIGRETFGNIRDYITAEENP